MTPDEREKLLLQLCDDALSKDASERAAFLDEACGGDAALREEVESLLAGRTEAQGFLVAFWANTRSAPTDGSTDSRPPLRRPHPLSSTST